MPSRKRGSAPADLTSESVAAMTDAEAIETAQTLDAEDQNLADATAKAERDAAILEALRNRTKNAPAGRTVEDLYNDLVRWVKGATGRTRLGEGTAVKVLELTIGWQLQTQRQAPPDFPTEDFEGGVGEEADDLPLPEPNERITAAEDE